jgi:predicted AAA+ superfamily ATPase
LGASWEGFIIEQLISFMETPAWYWSTHGGAELDLFTILNGKRVGFEIKYSDAPGLTKSMHIAIQNLQLEHLYVIYPGKQSYQLSEKVSVSNLFDLRKKL